MTSTPSLRAGRHARPAPLRWLLLIVGGLLRFVGQVVLIAYLLVSRGFLAVSAIYLILYFLAGARPVKQMIQQAVSDAIPGTITAASVQWGPLPWELRIAGGCIFDADGYEAIRVAAVDATIDLGTTIPGLFAYLGDSARNPMRVRFEHVDLLYPEAIVRVSDDDHVNIEDAFVGAPPAPGAPPETPMNMDLTAKTVRVIDASGYVEGPGVVAIGHGCNTVTDFAMTGDYFMDFTADLVRMSVAEVRLDFVPYVPGTVAIPVSDLVVDDYRWSALAFDWARATARLGPREAPWGAFDVHGRMDVAPAVVTFVGHGRFHLDAGAPITAAFTDGGMSGPMTIHVEGHGDVEQATAAWALTSPRLVLGSAPFEDVTAAGRFVPRGVDGDDYFHGIFVDAAEATLVGGRVGISDLAWDAPDPASHDRAHAPRDLTLAFEIADLDGPAAVSSVMSDFPLAALPWIAGRWSARGRFADTHVAALGRSVTELDIESGSFAWDAPHPALDGDYRFAGAAHIVNEPYHHEVALERVVLDRGEDRARLAGVIDLQSGAIDLEPYVRLGDVQVLADRLGLPRAAGRFVLKGARARGSIGDPRVTAVLNWSEASLDGRRVEKVQADLDYQDGVLRVKNAKSTSGLGDLVVDGLVRLRDPRLIFEATRVDARGLQLAPWLGDLGPTAELDLHTTQVAGSLLSPLTTLEGKAHVSLSNANLGGETISRLEADVVGDGKTLTLHKLDATLPAGRVTGELTFDSGTRRLQGRVHATDFDLAALSSVKRAAPELRATLTAELGLVGTLAKPSFLGTLGLSRVGWGDIRLGDAELAVQTLPDGKVDLSALDGTFFRGWSLTSAELALDGFIPKRLKATIEAKDLALHELLPALSGGRIAVSASGTATLDAALSGGGASSVSAFIAPGALVASLRDKNQAWSNTSPLNIVMTGDVTHIDPVGIGPRGGSAALELCGSIGRNLALVLAGRVELAFVPGLADSFSVADGGLHIAGATAPSVTLDSTGSGGRRRAAEESGSCLATADALSLTGTWDAPVIAGRLVADGVVLVPRGSGREIRIHDGSTFLLSTELERGVRRQVITLPEPPVGVNGEIDDGTFALSGKVVLDAFQPESAELDLVGVDLFLQSPGEYAVTASPRGHLSLEGLTGKDPVASLSGALAISEGRFSKSFDTIAQAIGGAAGTRTDAYSQSLVATIPWLADLRLDIDLTAPDFQIQTALPLARTDLPARLDLSLGGTFDAPLLYRRIDLLPGGVLTYFVFERAFQVSQGAIDFDGDPERPLVDVTAQTQVTYLARASTASLEEDEKEVTITLRMTGRVPDLKIELAADDATLDQADVQSLLLTGKPRGDLDRAQESRVFSPDFANFINTVLSAPFLKTASVAIGQQGALEYRVGTCFAPNLCFDTTTVSDDTETTLRAKFSLSIGDGLVCEGTLRRSDASTTAAQETYEARCRYRIPLE